MRTNRQTLELRQLETAGPWEVTPRLEAGHVFVHGVRLSEQWDPETTTILLELPEQYPARQPRVYIEEDVRFVGEHHAGTADQVQPAPNSTQSDVDWRPMYVGLDWDAECTLATLITYIEWVT